MTATDILTIKDIVIILAFVVLLYMLYLHSRTIKRLEKRVTQRPKARPRPKPKKRGWFR